MYVHKRSNTKNKQPVCLSVTVTRKQVYVNMKRYIMPELNDSRTHLFLDSRISLINSMSVYLKRIFTNQQNIYRYSPVKPPL